MNWSETWTQALPYGEFLARHGEPRHQERWQRIYDQVALTDAQRGLLASFTRRMHLLCVAGAWCGDCVLQGPVLQHLAEASPAVALRFVDRDAHAAVQDALMLNAGRRVPVVVFLSEDFQECGRYGDRTISMYRRMAQERLGAACTTGIVPPADGYVAAVTDDWVTEVERVQLMLRLSPRLRALHGD
ncbi:MAG: thioredoxin family protein [Armatimonadota bacterium]|nr:thioredoxin family protein [Armatimonadota bacterium]MDR7422144.1 thioredoxin family protein [Armatimonadota bacterium]MDR7455582.1 thioredoxin family protein [Armatimonadota bacterium]MDR7455764.1 thioredoxin family protein [Armatimonadota bacterium]MDR7496452.1 thioredoxin family protein [Armatimonadota bacterium]